MGTGHKLGQPVEDGTESGLRLIRRWRVLLAHDATASTCDLLVEAIEGAMGHVDIYESSSVDDARVAAQGGRFDVAMVCLDLPPAPHGGVRLAQEIVSHGVPVVLVTRSLRWIPTSAGSVRDLPWVAPDAAVEDVSRAVCDAMASLARRDSAPPPSARGGEHARFAGIVAARRPQERRRAEG